MEDVFFGGARGGGKSDGLLGDWLQHAGKYGVNARGILFRRSMPELEEVQRRALELFIRLGAYYMVQSKTWMFPNGASLKMRFLDSDADAGKYQGHQYTWIGIDEAGNFPKSDPIDKLRACLRSVHRVPCVMRLTGNPGGVGHEWLKKRYIDPATPMSPFYSEDDLVYRVFIPSRLEDNKILTENDPTYEKRLKAATSGSLWLYNAWRFGDWSEAPKGGMLDPGLLVRIPGTGFEIVKRLGLTVNFYIDLTTKEKQQPKDDPDFAVICAMARDSLERIHLLHMWAAQVSMDKQARQLILLRKVWKPRHIKGEKIGLQHAFRTVLRQTCRIERTPYFWVEDMTITGDKVFRAVPLQGVLNSGSICVPSEGTESWLPQMMHDWRYFPDGRYKDRVDAPAYGVMDLQEMKGADPIGATQAMKDQDIDPDEEFQRGVHQRIEAARSRQLTRDRIDDDE